MKLRCAFFAGCLWLAACQSSPRFPSTAANTGSANNGPAKPGSAQTGSASREIPTSFANVSGPILSYANIVDRVAPAVVTVRATSRVAAPQQFPFFNDPFFRQFFGDGPPQSGRNRAQVQEALGSGAIVRPDGYILTNYHVISGAQNIKVDLSNRQTYSAKLIGSDPPSDLAVLKISAGTLPALEMGNSDDVRVGDVCLALGNPLGVGETVTSGIISAKQRSTGLSGGNFEDFLQTDAPINKGNSGGPLVNTRGQMIGIDSEIISTTGASIGIGFAIPSNMAGAVMDQLIRTGKVQRGMLGISIQPVTSDIASSLGLKQVRGVLVNSVTAGDPGDKAGIKAGDVIVKFNGQDVNDPNTLRNEVSQTKPGTAVTLSIVRNGVEQEIHATVAELTPKTAPGGSGQSESQGQGPEKLGVTVAPLTPDTARQLNLPPSTQGLLIDSVDPSGPAALAGLMAGDVIQEVNRQRVRTIQDLQKALTASGNRPPLFLVNRNGQTIFVPVPLSQ
ncbi:MAG TPA: DegQ family serine endoprotease [Bryobacteraceae bacterium]|nr:DegQ family serine endoprotease [Bryobacteraceae bacterium]